LAVLLVEVKVFVPSWTSTWRWWVLMDRMVNAVVVRRVEGHRQWKSLEIERDCEM